MKPLTLTIKIIPFFCWLTIISQTKIQTNLFSELNAFYVHHGNMEILRKNQIFNFGAEVMFQNYREAEWQKTLNKPELGVGFNYSNNGNSDYLGDLYSLYSILTFNLYENQTIRWRSKMGLGLAFYTNPFDAVNNYKNIAIGSPINAYIKLGTDLYVKINKSQHLRIGGQFNHTSCGLFSSPNMGINTLGVSLGYSYTFNNNKTVDETIKIKNKSKIKEENSSFLMSMRSGITEVQPHGTYKKQLVLSTAATYSRKINKKIRLGAGVDFFFNNANRVNYNNDLNNTDEISILENITVGPYIDARFLIGDFYILGNLGIYLYDKLKMNSLIYQRIGINYNINSLLSTGISLKSHSAKAEVIEVALGIKI